MRAAVARNPWQKSTAGHRPNKWTPRGCPEWHRSADPEYSCVLGDLEQQFVDRRRQWHLLQEVALRHGLNHGVRDGVRQSQGERVDLRDRDIHRRSQGDLRDMVVRANGLFFVSCSACWTGDPAASTTSFFIGSPRSP